MKLLAIDLSYVGASGWVIWDTEAHDPVVTYGQVAPKVAKKDATNTVIVVDALYKELSDLTFKAWRDYQAVLVAYEYTDWHRGLSGRGKNADTEYFIERQAQRTLGRAEAVLILAARNYNLKVYGIGANEAKKEFGALRKDACAHLFAEEYPRFKFLDEVKDEALEYLFDTILEQKVAHHISDAFVIAKVVAGRLGLAEMLGV